MTNFVSPGQMSVSWWKTKVSLLLLYWRCHSFTFNHGIENYHDHICNAFLISRARMVINQNFYRLLYEYIFLRENVCAIFLKFTIFLLPFYGSFDTGWRVGDCENENWNDTVPVIIDVHVCIMPNDNVLFAYPQSCIKILNFPLVPK